MAFVNDVVSLGSDVIIQGKNLDLVAKWFRRRRWKQLDLYYGVDHRYAYNGLNRCINLNLGNGEMVETGKPVEVV